MGAAEEKRHSLRIMLQSHTVCTEQSGFHSHTGTYTMNFCLLSLITISITQSLGCPESSGRRKSFQSMFLFSDFCSFKTTKHIIHTSYLNFEDVTASWVTFVSLNRSAGFFCNMWEECDNTINERISLKMSALQRQIQRDLFLIWMSIRCFNEHRLQNKGNDLFVFMCVPSSAFPCP